MDLSSGLRAVRAVFVLFWTQWQCVAQANATRAGGTAWVDVTRWGGWAGPIDPITGVGHEMSVAFQDYNGVHVFVGVRGRRWQAEKTVTGWRLEFRDSGDATATYAGTHTSLQAALLEARKDR
jgi:hypothetical protein